jgi:hypothetical protein
MMGDLERKDCKVSMSEKNNKYPWVKEMTDDGLLDSMGWQLSYSERNDRWLYVKRLTGILEWKEWPCSRVEGMKMS